MPWTDCKANAIPDMDKKILQHINKRSLKAGGQFNLILVGSGNPPHGDDKHIWYVIV